MTNLVAMTTAVLLGVLPSTTSRIDYTAIGGTTFTFGFKVTDTSHIKVFVDADGAGTASTFVEQTTGITKSLDPVVGGGVVFAVAPTPGATVRIERTVPVTQDSVWTPYSAFKAKTLEGVLDKLVMHDQQADRRAGDTDATHAADKATAASQRTTDLMAQATRDSGQDSTVTSLINGEANARATEDTSIRSQVASAALGGGVNIADTSTVAATTTGTTKQLKDWAAEIERANGAWYVDSVNGLDANDGQASATPLRTIAALLAKPLKAGAVINLARGSYWREQMYGLPTGARVLAFGSGPRPVFDGADVIAPGAWTKTGGLTNVYQTSVTVDALPYFSPGKMRYRVWVNGAPLAWVADQATCDATAGSWTGLKTATAGPDILYVHPLGSTDPRVDGKTYEIPRRSWGLNCGQYKTDHGCAEIVGVHARRQLHDDGALLSAGIVRDSVADDGSNLTGAVVANPDGPSHAFWNNGYAEDVVAYGTNPFITYAEPTVAFKRATAFPVVNGYGFFFHWVAPSAFKQILFDECKTYGSGTQGAAMHVGGGDYTNVVLLNNEAYRVGKVFEGTGAGVSSTVILGGRFVLTKGLGKRGLSIILANPSHSLIVRGARFVAQEATDGGMIYDTSGGSLDVQNSTCAWSDPAVFEGQRGFVVKTTGPSVVSYSLVHNGTGATFASGNPLTGNYNITSQDATWWSAGNAYANLAAWQATGQDAQTVIELQTLPGSIWDGDTRVSTTSSAHTNKIGADASGASQDVIGQYARDWARSTP
jgi:hypothetical protein